MKDEQTPNVQIVSKTEQKDEVELCGVFQMVVVSDDVHEYAVALKDTEDKMARCPSRVSQHVSLPAVMCRSSK